MEILADNLSKRYFYQWVIKDFNYSFKFNQSYGIAGRNGSGKSTLIKMLCGYLTPSTGKVKYLSNVEEIKVSDIFKFISLSAPYTDIIQEFSLEENYNFHKKFKPFSNNIDYKEFLHLCELSDPKDKALRFFSSGMKQKAQLALAILSETKILLLDEPTAYLDDLARIWFRNLLEKNTADKVLIIASNDKFDIEICENRITLS